MTYLDAHDIGQTLPCVDEALTTTDDEIEWGTMELWIDRLFMKMLHLLSNS
jgi:hypothetical protein